MSFDRASLTASVTYIVSPKDDLPEPSGQKDVLIARFRMVTQKQGRVRTTFEPRRAAAVSILLRSKTRQEVHVNGHH